MPSYVLNIADCRGMPPADALAILLQGYGRPADSEFAILNAHGGSDAAYATLVIRRAMKLTMLAADRDELEVKIIERVSLLPFALLPRVNRVELYAGTAAGFETIGAFLSSGLGLPVVLDRREVDLLDLADTLARTVKRFQLRAVTLSEYAANSYVLGRYSPKCVSSENGREFAQQNAEAVDCVQCRFAGPTGRVSVTLRDESCVGYSCQEDDQSMVQDQLRKLLTGEPA